MRPKAETAVALHYSDELPAPMVVAAGRGALAAAIARIARENGVPLVADAELADTLIELDVNTLIPESLYEIIARLLVFVRGLQPATEGGIRPATEGGIRPATEGGTQPATEGGTRAATE